MQGLDEGAESARFRRMILRDLPHDGFDFGIGLRLRDARFKSRECGQKAMRPAVGQHSRTDPAGVQKLASGLRK